MYRKLRTATLVLGVSVAVFFGLCAGCPFTNQLILRPFLANFDSRYTGRSHVPKPFDGEAWRRGRASDRVPMAVHLAEHGLLEGKTRAELVQLLGEPDIDKPGQEGTRWLLGFMAKGLFDETYWLYLTLKSDGTATGAIVGRDWHDPRR